MQAKILVPVAAALAMGCTASLQGTAGAPPAAAASMAPAGTVVAAPTSAAVQADPYSVPFAQLLVTGDYFARGESEKAVLSSSAELEAFLARHPAGSISSRDDLRRLDFTKYRVVAYLEGQPEPAETARITRVVDQPEALVVHTTRWTYGDAMKSASPDSRPAVHFVGLPRDGKPVTFASTEKVELPVTYAEPSAMPGVPGLQTQRVLTTPTWRAVPNPEVTREVVEARVRTELEGSTITSLTIEKATISALMGQFGATHFRNVPYTPESEVWFVRGEGKLTARFLGRGGGGTTYGNVMEVMSIETGMILFGGGSTPAEPGPSIVASPRP